MKTRSKWIGAALAAALFALGAALFVHAPPARQYALEKLRIYLRDTQGIQLDTSTFDYNLLTLSAKLEGISLRSMAAGGLPPFLSLDSAAVNLRWSGLLRGMASVEEARIEGVSFQIVIDEQGRSNLPQIETSGSSGARRDFLVSALDAARGSMIYEDRRRKLRVELPLWGLQVKGASGTLDHAIRFQTAEPGSVTFENRSVPVRSFSLEATLGRTAVDLARLRIDSEATQVSLGGRIENLERPTLKLNLTAEMDAARAAWLAGIPEKIEGTLRSDISITGALDAMQASTRIEGSGLSWQGYRQISLDARARWDQRAERLQVETLALRSPQGSVAGRANLALAEAVGESRLEATIHDLSLLDISRRQRLPIQIASRAAATVSARWPGLEFKKMAGEAKLELSGSQPAPSSNVLPVAGALSVEARNDRVRVQVESLEALGSRWQGEVSLESLDRLSGELRATVAERFVWDLEGFLGRERDSLLGSPVTGAAKISAMLGGTLRRPEVRATLEASRLTVGSVRDMSLEARVEYSTDRVRIEDLSLRWQEQSLAARGEIGLAGPSPALDLDARITQASVAAILSGLENQSPLDGSFDLVAKVKGTTDRMEGTVSVSAAGLQAYGETLGNLAIEAQLADQKIEVKKFRLDKPHAGHFDATGSYAVDSRAYQLYCEAKDLRFTSLRLPEDLPVVGVLNLSCEGDGTFERPRLVLKAGLADLKVGDRLVGNVNTVARIEDGRANLEAQAPRFNLSSKAEAGVRSPFPADVEITAQDTDLSRLDDALKGHLTATLKGTGDLAAWEKGRVSTLIRDLLVTVRDRDIRNDGPVELSYQDGTLTVPAAVLKTGDSRLSISGSLPGLLEARGRFEAADLLVFAPEEPGFSATGTLQLDAELRGTLQKLDPAVRLTMSSGTLDREDLNVELTSIDLDLHYDKGFVRIEKAAANFGPAEIHATGEAPLSMLVADLPLVVRETQEPATFTLDVRDLELRAFRAIPEEVSGTIGLRVEGEIPRLNDWTGIRANATFPQLDIKVADYQIRQEAPSAISIRDGAARIDQLVLTGPGTRLEAGGTAMLTEKIPLDLRLVGDLDVGVLTLFTEGFKVAGPGRLQIAATGDLSAPRLSGFFEMNDGQVNVVPPRMLAESLALRLNLSPHRVTVERFSGLLNGGPLQGSGWIDYSGAGLQNVHLDLSADRAFLDFPPGLRTQVEVALQIRSRDDLVVIGGEAHIIEGSYRDPLELEGELLSYLRAGRAVELTEERSPFLSRLRYDVALDTKGAVLVDNNLAKIALSGNLRLGGSYYRPALTGRITLAEGGQIYLNERKYFVDRGVISFVNETRIEPNIDLLAKTRVRNYDIDLTVSGGPEDLSATFTSDPPLSEPDIISVLVTGRTLDEVQGAELNVAKEQALSYLSGRVAGRLSRGAEQALGLSQVRIEPNLIAAESDPGGRLTVEEDLTDFLRLIYSMNLTDSSDQIYIADYEVTKRFNARTIRQDDNSYRFEFRHGLQFGGGSEESGHSAVRRTQRIGAIDFAGTPVFPQKTLADKLKVEPGDRYDFFKVQKGIDRLESHYEKQGRLEARVRVSRETREEKVDLAVKIDAGPEVEIAFEGADPGGAVRNQVRRIWKEGLFDAQRADECVQAIRRSLVEGHFLQSKVDYKIDTRADGVKRVTFHIAPGARFRNVPVIFEGASGIEGRRLLSTLESEKLTAEIYIDPRKVVQLLALFYRQNGYLEAKVHNPRYALDAGSGTGKVIIAVEEGLAFRVADVAFRGNNAFEDSRLGSLVALSAGSAYAPELLETSVAKLEEFYWGEGYNDVVAGYTVSRASQPGFVDVAFRITENKQGVVQQVHIEGNRQTGDRFVQNQMSVTAGDVLDFTKTSRSRKSLYDTGAYSLVDIQTHPVEDGAGIPANNQKPVAVRVKLRELRRFDLRYGAFYDTDRGPGFIADFANRNSLGSARVLGARTRYDSDIREIRGYFSQPLLRSFPLRTNVVGFLRRELFDTFITDRTGVSVQQEAHVRNRMILSYGYRFERTDTFDKDPESIFKVPPFNIAPLTATLSRDMRDDPLDAARGSFFSHALEYAPSLLGSDLRFVKYFGQYFKYVPLSDPSVIPFSGGVARSRLVYAGGVRLGLGKGLGGQQLTRSERFFAGGGTTLRGFPQNAVGPRDFLGDPEGGDAVFLTNHELRFPLVSLFDGVGFLDIGNVYSRIGDFDPFSVRKSAGFGLRARTPYFLLRFDYGFKLDRRPGESLGGFFISIGQAF